MPDFESVPTVPKARMACHHGHVADRKVVLTSKVGAKMFIRNSPMLGVSLFVSNALLMGLVPLFSAPLFVRLVLLFLVCFVPFFLAHLSSFPVPVLVLSSSGKSASQQK